MNKKGSAILVIILILIIVVLVFIYPLGRGQDISDIKDKIDKLTCPDVNTNMTCEFGVDVYNDARGCVQARCMTTQDEEIALTESGTLQVFFIDVGQGDGIYIETPEEKKVVIDAGTGYQMGDFLAFRGVDKIDWLIQTHPDSDHIGGIDEVFDNTVVLHYLTTNQTCGTDACDQVFIAEQNEEGLDYNLARSGFEFKEIDLIWEFLAPNELIFKDRNDNSIVIRLIYGDVEILFTGDCAEECEEMLIRLGKNVQADILKVGHHGSDSSTSAEFLAAVNPAYGILSYGINNQYNHPSREVIDRLVTRDVQLLKTAVVGNIEMRTDGKKVEWYCEKRADCFS